MSAYPKVKAGDKFRPSARKENALSDLLNAGFRISGKNSAKQMFFSRIAVFNQDTIALVANSAVFFSTTTSVGDAVPCKKYSAGETQWGVLTASLAPGEFGSCIVSGPVKVKISVGTGNYVQPNPTTPDVFTPSDNGVPILYREGSYAIINLGGGESAERKHQFQVIDSSETSSAGTVTLKIRVQNGHNPDSDIAGKLNDTDYVATTITLVAGTSEYYVYALNGSIYALNHEFQSDFFPVLRLATVTVAYNKLTIVQESVTDDPTVPVCGSIYGAVTLSGTVVVQDHVATTSYSVTVKGMLNNMALTFPTTDLPETVAGQNYLLAYIDKITVENDAAPVKGFEFSSSGSPSADREWYVEMFRYRLTETSFHVDYRRPELNMFTFTQLYLNDSEVSDD